LANHKSAKKRARQCLKRRDRNRHVRLRDAERALRKAASKGVISKKQASRRLSRLAKRAHALGA
jgi:ribosomal protein S20